jgi:oligosaccharide repeat unit polymerase
MSWVSVACFGISLGILLTMVRKGADPFSPARVFGFIWSFAIGLTDLKLSGLQHDWKAESWILLLIGVGSLLAGIFIAYAVNSSRTLTPIAGMREGVRRQRVNEPRLFWLICVSVLLYAVAFLVNYWVRGWLPIFVVGTNLSRVDFNVYGLTLVLYTAAFIVIFTVLYTILVPGKRNRKIILVGLAVIVVGSYFLLLNRFQIVLAMVVCVTLAYYTTPHIRLRTVSLLFAVFAGFSFWISSLRLSHVVATFLYTTSKMKFSKDFAILTEPYMYVAMNLENFARAVSRLEYHTYGYFTFDFVTAVTGLKYWLVDYLNLDRSPFLISGYNTYSAFWWFYMDFGVIGLAVIPHLLGLGSGLLYYRMRSTPTIGNITAYGVMVFILVISFFEFPIVHLWFHYNILALFLILRWTMNLPRHAP